jgi:hypothetical protein
LSNSGWHKYSGSVATWIFGGTNEESQVALFGQSCLGATGAATSFLMNFFVSFIALVQKKTGRIFLTEDHEKNEELSKRAGTESKFKSTTRFTAMSTR